MARQNALKVLKPQGNKKIARRTRVSTLGLPVLILLKGPERAFQLAKTKVTALTSDLESDAQDVC